jgi:3'-5' exoribonuclease
MDQKQIYINQMKEGQQIQDIFVITQAKYGQSKNGPFWDLQVQDCTGQMNAKIWSPQSQEYPHLQPEQFIQIQAHVSSFRNQLQLIIRKLEHIDTQAIENVLFQFIPCTSIPPQELLAQLEQLYSKELHYPPWKKFCRSVLNTPSIRERILTAPGAKKIHHAYKGGLLEHTLSVTRLCLAISEIYPQVDKELLLVAALFHDLGKAWEYIGYITSEFTDQGRLLGHIILTLEILEPFFQAAEELDDDLILHLKHILLSHHGEYVYGSPKRPKTIEAMILHYADNLDAKVTTVKEALSCRNEDSQWSSYIPSLERPVYQPTKQTPSIQKEPKDNKKRMLQQCLLPLKE